MRVEGEKMKSLIKQSEGECYLCALLDSWPKYYPAGMLDKHHIFGGPNRKLSEKYGLYVYLCQHHHTGDIKGNKDAVHSPDKNDYGDFLKRLAQTRFEETHSREEFRQIFGKSYL